jgi:hypothetical protein
MRRDERLRKTTTRDAKQHLSSASKPVAPRKMPMSTYLTSNSSHDLALPSFKTARRSTVGTAQGDHKHEDGTKTEKLTLHRLVPAPR